MEFHYIVLRIIHIFCGVVWAGFALTNFVFLRPAVKATGESGQIFMRYLSQSTYLMSAVYTAATLTMLSGLAMYWPLAESFHTFIGTGYGIVLTVGSVTGVIAWIIAVGIIRGILNKLQAIGNGIQSQEGPPSGKQAEGLKTLGKRLDLVGKMAVIFLVITIISMAIARYVTF